jgi:hypothetical protein
MTTPAQNALWKRLDSSSAELERCVVNAVNICAHVAALGVDQIRRDAKNGKTHGYRAEYGTAPALVEAAHAALWVAIANAAQVIREARPLSATSGWNSKFQDAHGSAANAVGLLRALEGASGSLSGQCDVTRVSEHAVWLVDGAAGYGGWRAPMDKNNTLHL